MTRLAIRSRLLALAWAVVLGPGCEGSREDAGGERPATRPRAVDEGRDQYRLASLIDEARGGDRAAGPGELERLRQSWLHTRVRWEVGYAPAFCRESGPCAVLPFDHCRLRSRLPQGWLPELSLDADARGELSECCAAVQGQCVFEVEATLARLELGHDRPTSLALTDVELGTCRGAHPQESWVRRSPGAKSTAGADPHVALSRTGPAEG